MTKSSEDRGACISDCGLYRYALWRIWDNSLQQVTWVMLNPSTADHEVDDPTIRRVTSFTRDAGYGGFSVLNLFAFRSPSPRAMKSADDPIGPHNMAYFSGLVADRQDVVAAWGTNGGWMDRDLEIMRVLCRNKVMCLGTTKDGYPRHPLRLPKTQELIPYNGRQICVA